MNKMTGIPVAASLWLRENNLTPESISVNETNIALYFHKSTIYMSLHDDKIKYIRYSPESIYN